MRKLNILISTVAVVTLLAPAGFGFAQSSLDLGAESTGLLPSNPFYFLKEFGRGFRQFLAFNPVRKAQLELNVANEKAAELKKLEEITPENLEAIKNAAENYKSAVERLSSRLESLRSTGENPNLERLLDQLAERSLKHQQLFDELVLTFQENEDLLSVLDQAQDGLAKAVAVASSKVDSPAKFRRRFSSAVENHKDDLKELRGAEIIDRVEDEITGEEARKEISILKEDLLLKFSGRLEGLDSVSAASAILEEFADNHSGKLRLLDEVREKVINPEIKSGINVLRQRIISGIESKGGIGKEEAEKAILNAQRLLEEVLAKIDQRGGIIKSSVKELANRAKFALDQASKFYNEENYGAAYGQATSAYAAAKSAWAQLISDVNYYNESLESLKVYYDSLREKATFLNLNKEQNPKLFALFSEAERRIVELGKLIETKASPEAITAILRNVKVALASIEELIKGITEPRVPPSAAPLPAESPIPPSSAVPAIPIKDILVAVLDDGFFPSVLRISKGTKVTWVNKNTASHWPASDNHPENQILPEFNTGKELKTGDTYSFVFEKVGIWTYHDHLNPELKAVVEVVE